jgi:hypothetical protein
MGGTRTCDSCNLVLGVDCYLPQSCRCALQPIWMKMVVEWLDIPGQSEFFVRQGHGVSLGFLAFDPGWTRTCQLVRFQFVTM